VKEQNQYMTGIQGFIQPHKDERAEASLAYQYSLVDRDQRHKKMSYKILRSAGGAVVAAMLTACLNGSYFGYRYNYENGWSL